MAAAAQHLAQVKDLKADAKYQLLAQIQEGPFSDELKDRLTKLVLSKLSLRDEPSCEVNGYTRQAFHTMPYYLQVGQPEADLIFQAGADLQMRLQCLASLSRKCGCNHPDKFTMALFTACAFHDADVFEQVKLSTHFGLEKLMEFSAVLNRTNSVIPGHSPTQFPGFESFEEQHPLLHASARFLPGRGKAYLDAAFIAKIFLIAKRIPRRRGHRGDIKYEEAQLHARKKKYRNLVLGIANDFARSIPPREPQRTLTLTSTASQAAIANEAPAAHLASQTTPFPLEIAAPVADTPVKTASINRMIDCIFGARGAATKKANVAVVMATPPAETAAIKKAKAQRPKSVHVEWSQKHVLARTGLEKKPKTKAFQFESEAGILAAKKKALQWLKEMGA